MSSSETNKWIAGAAIFMSVLALVVSMYQNSIMRKQQHGSVWPYLQPNGIRTNEYFEWTITNNGIGPAIIKNINIAYDDTSYSRIDFLLNSLKEDFDLKFNSTSTQNIDNYVFRPEEKATLFKGYFANDSTRQIVPSIIFEELRLSLCYCSVFDKCWLLEGEKVQQVKSCQ